MEALADFGAVNLLGYRALTDAIYRVWYGAFDQAAALQLATVLVEPGARAGRARAAAARPGPLPRRRSRRGDAVVPRRAARRARRARDRAAAAALLLVVVGLPVLQLVVWAVETVAEGAASADRARADGGAQPAARGGRRRCWPWWPRPSSSTAARTRPSRLGARRARLRHARLRGAGHRRGGRGLRAAGVAGPPAVAAAASCSASTSGCCSPGTVLGLVVAYVVRFHALACFSVESRMAPDRPALDDAARALGADPPRARRRPRAAARGRAWRPPRCSCSSR